MSVKKYVKDKLKELTTKDKVNEQELHNLRLRTGNKEQKEFELYIINNELRRYIDLLLHKYEKSGEEYKINLANGEIEEIKKPKLEAQPEGVSAAEVVKEK